MPLSRHQLRQGTVFYLRDSRTRTSLIETALQIGLVGLDIVSGEAEAKHD